jgi:ubiquinone/menaquinone biosynthesis C-methylase UbiE
MASNSHQEETATLDQTREAWNRIAPGYSEFVTPTHMWVADQALERAGLRSGMRLLDVAAGSGALSIPAARRGAQVLSTDLSPGMLEQLAARARVEGLTNLETRVMDGHALELEDDSFDLAASQFGVMLFPDLPRAIREMARVTRPGGQVVIVAYGHPSRIEFFNFFVSAIQAVVPTFSGPPMDPLPLPFQLQDPNRLQQELTVAGLSSIRVETITENLEFQSGRHMWSWVINSNPLATSIIEGAKLSAREIRDVKQALQDRLRDHSAGQSPAVLTNPINIGVGRK